jgi:hypothetical protein
VESVDEVGAGAVVLAGPALALVDVRLAVTPLEANNAVALVALGNKSNLNNQYGSIKQCFVSGLGIMRIRIQHFRSMQIQMRIQIQGFEF